MVSSWGQNHGLEFFGVKSIPYILSNLNLLLNYPVVAPIILINTLVPLNTLFHAIQSISKFLQYLRISGKRQKSHVILNIILWLEVSRNIQSVNGHVIWFHCPNFYGGATKYNTLCNSVIRQFLHFSSISENIQTFSQSICCGNANFGLVAEEKPWSLTAKLSR